MKDYYKILGISPYAEISEISAAYRALAQIYHPDKWKGDKKTGDNKIREINEAYDTLKNKNKKQKYDKEYFASKKDQPKQEDFTKQNYEQNKDFIDGLDALWKVVIEFYPDIEEERIHLHKIDKALSQVFQKIIIGTKSASDWQEMASLTVTSFFKSILATDKLVLHRFVELILLEGKRNIAIETIDAINIIGDKDTDIITDKIEVKYEDKLKFVENDAFFNWENYFEDYEYRNHTEKNDFYDWLSQETVSQSSNVFNGENSISNFILSAIAYLCIIILVVYGLSFLLM